MDMHTRKQYLSKLKQDYLNSNKQQKGKILDEYIKNTAHNRKYVIQQLNNPKLLKSKQPKKRTEKYGPEVVAVLRVLYKIFDRPCGQRLKESIDEELERLVNFGEVKATKETVSKVKSISSATIDRKLKPYKRIRQKGVSTTKPGTLLKKQIAIRVRYWDTTQVGFCETDLVAHCGDTAQGEFLNSVSLTDISSGWWEAESIMGKGQIPTTNALKSIKTRTPFKWLGLDSDNGSEFINQHLFKFCKKEQLTFTRSRPYYKNDNAHIEQKNWTHIRKVFGYNRYDTTNEQRIMNDLYRNELRLYKNFFQPQIKTIRKESDGFNKPKKQRDNPMTPYKRLMTSKQITKETKKELTAIYESLNPAELKRQIDKKLSKLFRFTLDKNSKSDIIYKIKSEPRKEVLVRS